MPARDPRGGRFARLPTQQPACLPDVPCHSGTSLPPHPQTPSALSPPLCRRVLRRLRRGGRAGVAGSHVCMWRVPKRQRFPAGGAFCFPTKALLVAAQKGLHFISNGAALSRGSPVQYSNHNPMHWCGLFDSNCTDLFATSQCAGHTRAGSLPARSEPAAAAVAALQAPAPRVAHSLQHRVDRTSRRAGVPPSLVLTQAWLEVQHQAARLSSHPSIVIWGASGQASVGAGTVNTAGGGAEETWHDFGAAAGTAARVRLPTRPPLLAPCQAAATKNEAACLGACVSAAT